ncbi:hypothetical protein [Clavibacter capsici]|uniref:hypothetical protein n=1 Tax=Clavibacter capsici TaxID=1874630 RepID=UPI0012FE88C0|nr:hypothetical protein [Clavibacter capsici]
MDLGQGQDNSALAVVERVLVLPPMVSLGQFWRQPETFGPQVREELHVRHLTRWELQTPYDVVVGDVAGLMRRPSMIDAMLLLDGSGVGRAVRDMVYAEWNTDPFGVCPPIAVTATGGLKRHGWNVPKRDLLAAIQVRLQTGTLRIAKGLVLGDQLERELTSFRQKISAAGRDTFEVQRKAGEGHGDLVSALALAVFQPNTIGRPAVIESAHDLMKETTDV